MIPRGGTGRLAATTIKAVARKSMPDVGWQISAVGVAGMRRNGRNAVGGGPCG
jgi:hypothetical protein